MSYTLKMKELMQMIQAYLELRAIGKFYLLRRWRNWKSFIVLLFAFFFFNFSYLNLVNNMCYAIDCIIDSNERLRASGLAEGNWWHSGV